MFLKLLLCLLVAFPLLAADTTLISAGATWKYKDDGSDQGTAWRNTAFDDSAWAGGPAELGYGDGGEATVVSYGGNSSNKYITTYFRKAFTVTNPGQFTTLTLNLVRDDGAVVYLNGTEVWRTNMPGGAIGYTTTASTALGGADESTWYTTTANPALLINGTNVIAVEIHQANVTSSDISFNFSLIASDGSATLTRQPYLQMGSPTAMTIRWRTNVPTDSRVEYGATQGALSDFEDAPAVTTEHEVRLTGLLADTKYFYSVGTTTEVLAGDDANTYFFTNPAPGTVRPYRFWVIGDAGTGQTAQRNVRDAYTNFNGSGRTDLWLQLGDNVYDSGQDSEYQTRSFDIYTLMYKTSVSWPAIGNHDTAQATNPPLTIPYFLTFTLPTAAEAGGVASGTEKYYSFDYGNVHFIELDSQTSSRAPGGAMAAWLQADLAANNKRWTVAYFHHPPYSKGTHNSDTETQLVEMRENINPILEAGGVDLVLAGHSHTYERSFLLDGHYGLSGTLTNEMKIDGGPGPYAKAGTDAHEGTVYVVAGTSGRTGSHSGLHPAMYSTLDDAGSLVLDVNGDQMDVRFLTQAGVIAESFTITKGSNPTPPDAPSGVAAVAVSGTQINLAWTDHSSDEDEFRIERSQDGGPFAQIASVGQNVTAYSDTNLSPATQYDYRVRAHNDAGDSDYSNEASATTLDGTPAAPGNLTAEAQTTGRGRNKTFTGTVELNWADNSNNETEFVVELCDSFTTSGKGKHKTVSCDSWVELDTTSADDPTYLHDPADPNTTYIYRVKARNGAGDSGYSNEASVSTPSN